MREAGRYQPYDYFQLMEVSLRELFGIGKGSADALHHPGVATDVERRAKVA